MKTISARKFRLGFTDLTEPVTVLTRSEDGTFRELGTWTPATEPLPVYRPGDLGAALSRFGHSSPAPKPSAKAKR